VPVRILSRPCAPYTKETRYLLLKIPARERRLLRQLLCPGEGSRLF